MQTSRSRKNYGHEHWKLPEAVGRAFHCNRLESCTRNLVRFLSLRGILLIDKLYSQKPTSKYYSHFTDEDIETQSNGIPCLESGSE